MYVCMYVRTDGWMDGWMHAGMNICTVYASVSRVRTLTMELSPTRLPKPHVLKPTSSQREPPVMLPIHLCTTSDISPAYVRLPTTYTLSQYYRHIYILWLSEA